MTKKGWYKESYRHSLAARGVSTTTTDSVEKSSRIENAVLRQTTFSERDPVKPLRVNYKGHIIEVVPQFFSGYGGLIYNIYVDGSFVDGIYCSSASRDDQDNAVRLARVYIDGDIK